MNKILYLLFFVFCIGCGQAKTEKHQRHNRIVDVREKVKEIVIEDVFIRSNNRLYLAGDYLIITDSQSMDEVMHLFDKDNFRYITGFGKRGQGPGEIASMGICVFDEVQQKLYVTDHGKNCIYSYDLGSALANPQYMPETKIKTNNSQFPADYQYYNDTLCIARIIDMDMATSRFQTSVAKWNMLTGEITPMKYRHPEIERKNSCVASSLEHGIYVEYYFSHDLMSIFTFDGELKYNIYGENWTTRSAGKKYYDKVIFCKDRIIAAYMGASPSENYTTKLHVFDITGDYIQTLETGYVIVDFCYDEDNNRILMSLNAMMQFAYLDLDGLI